jgi:outer membrane usher protein
MQLEVILNGTPTKLIGSFAMLDGNRLAATRQELQELGLNPRGVLLPDKVVVLDEVSGLSYRYEEATQRVLITASEEQLAVKEYDLRGPAPELARAQSDWGGVLNYNVYTAGVSAADARPLSINGIPISINGIPTKFIGTPIAFNGASATFDARVFTPFGTLSQSAILRTSLNDRVDALRLTTTMSYSDPETLMSYRAGDVINGGFAWTRPIRIGGVQMQRNFACGRTSLRCRCPLRAAAPPYLRSPMSTSTT